MRNAVGVLLLSVVALLLGACSDAQLKEWGFEPTSSAAPVPVTEADVSHALDLAQQADRKANEARTKVENACPPQASDATGGNICAERHEMPAKEALLAAQAKCKEMRNAYNQLVDRPHASSFARSWPKLTDKSTNTLTKQTFDCGKRK